jgi:hypothetical protein
MLYGANCNYKFRNGKHGGIDIRHIIAESREEAGNIYEQLLRQEKKVANTYGFEKGYGISEIEVFSKEDII